MKKTILFLFILFNSSFASFSQTTNDAGLWSTFNFEKKLKHNSFIFFTEELRLRENFTRLNLLYTEVGVGIQPYKFLKVSLAYRSIDKYLIDNTFSFRHRLMLDISLKKKIGTILLSYRQRLQSEVRNVYTSENGSLPESYSRNKFEIKYDPGKRVMPYFATELRYQVRNPRLIEADKKWHRSRFIMGIDFEKNKRDKFGFYYLIQGEFNLSAPQNIYIIGLEYSISI